jgi:hypothetical protein
MGVGDKSHAPPILPPQRNPVLHAEEARLDPGPIWARGKKSRPKLFSIPGPHSPFISRLESPWWTYTCPIPEVSRSHLYTQHLVGLLWTRDRPIAVTSTWQRTKLIRGRQPCPWRESNSRPQHASGSKSHVIYCAATKMASSTRTESYDDLFFIYRKIWLKRIWRRMIYLGVKNILLQISIEPGGTFCYGD